MAGLLDQQVLYRGGVGLAGASFRAQAGRGGGSYATSPSSAPVAASASTSTTTTITSSDAHPLSSSAPPSEEELRACSARLVDLFAEVPI